MVHDVLEVPLAQLCLVQRFHCLKSPILVAVTFVLNVCCVKLMRTKKHVAANESSPFWIHGNPRNSLNNSVSHFSVEKTRLMVLDLTKPCEVIATCSPLSESRPILVPLCEKNLPSPHCADHAP
jgi:hypothetical protein